RLAQPTVRRDRCACSPRRGLRPPALQGTRACSGSSRRPAGALPSSRACCSRSRALDRGCARAAWVADISWCDLFASLGGKVQKTKCGKAAYMIAPDLETAIDELQELLESARVIAPFTGAGISTECGIPDFRSPGGLWTKNKP